MSLKPIRTRADHSRALEEIVKRYDRVTAAPESLRGMALPWATLVCSAMELTQPYRALPKLTSWTTLAASLLTLAPPPLDPAQRREPATGRGGILQ